MPLLRLDPTPCVALSTKLPLVPRLPPLNTGCVRGHATPRASFWPYLSVTTTCTALKPLPQMEKHQLRVASFLGSSVPWQVDRISLLDSEPTRAVNMKSFSFWKPGGPSF